MSTATKIVDRLIEGDMDAYVRTAASPYIESWAWKDRTSDRPGKKGVGYHWYIRFQLSNDHAVDFGVELFIGTQGRMRYPGVSVKPFCREHTWADSVGRVDKFNYGKEITVLTMSSEEEGRVLRSMFAAKQAVEHALYQEYFRITEPEEAKAHGLQTVQKIFDAHMHGSLQ